MDNLKVPLRAISARPLSIPLSARLVLLDFSCSTMVVFSSNDKVLSINNVQYDYSRIIFESLQETTSKAVSDAHSAQMKSHLLSVSLEVEVSRLGAHNKELKEGYTQMRYGKVFSLVTFSYTRTVTPTLTHDIGSISLVPSSF